jgi:hypothetical protein
MSKRKVITEKFRKHDFLDLNGNAYYYDEYGRKKLILNREGFDINTMFEEAIKNMSVTNKGVANFAIVPQDIANILNDLNS